MQLLAVLQDFSSSFCSVSNKLLTTMVCLGGARLHDDSKVICLDLAEIYWQGRGKEEEEVVKEEQKVACKFWMSQ